MANYTTDIHSYHQGLSFDGMDDYIYPTVGSLPSFTIELILRIPTTSSQSISNLNDSLPSGTTNSHNLFTNSNGTVTGRIFDSGDSTAKNVTSTTNICDGENHHISLTGENGGELKLYIDGVLEDQDSINTIFSSFSNGYYTVGIDRQVDNYLEGVVDQLRIWNLVRNQTEIQDNINKSLSGDETGLIVYYPMNEGLGDIIYDHTSNQNDGTINGATWTNKVGFKG